MIPFIRLLSKLAALPSHNNVVGKWKTILCGRIMHTGSAAPSGCVGIMRAGKGFVLPLRTPSTAEGTAGMFSCYPCWRADRRARIGAHTSQTAYVFCCCCCCCCCSRHSLFQKKILVCVDSWCRALLNWFENSIKTNMSLTRLCVWARELFFDVK